MTSSFAEFLEKQKQIMATDLGLQRHGKEFFIRAQGEWAWGQNKDEYWLLFKAWFLDSLKHQQIASYDYDVRNFYFDVAVACLGEAECRKRLEALSQVND